VRTGRDYRGVGVLTASQHVNGLPWTVVAKTDSSEYAAPLLGRERRLAVLIGAAVLLAAVMLLVLWQGEQAVFAGQQERAEADRRALSRHFAQLTRLARDIILMIDPDGRIIDANEAAIAAYGYSEAELYQLTVAELRTPEEYRRYEEDWRAGEAPHGVLVETVHRRKDGSTFPVEVSGRTIEVDGKRYRQAFMRDISVRKRLERQVARLSDVKTGLQAATSVLLHGMFEEEIYQQICEIAVRLGRYRMANVAAPVEDAEKTVRIAAVAGDDNGYLAQARISWGVGPRGQGPTGTALRVGETQVNQDFAVNPRMALWRDAALSHGFHSSIALPLKVAGKVIAAFTIYAAEPDAFDSDEVALLEALADDIAFAVTKLRTVGRS
jgi:PAS domain S-box-containing protein